MMVFCDVPMPPEEVEAKHSVVSAPSPTLTQEYLKEILNYDPETGIWTWKVRTACCVHVGDIAGTFNTPYRRITIGLQMYKASRLAFLYMEGSLPPPHLDVDHRNRVKSDDSWTNLRLATAQQNSQNTPMSRRNTSGFKGVCWHKTHHCWIAQSRVNGVIKFLGYFSTPELASAAYLAFVTPLHDEFLGETKT